MQRSLQGRGKLCVYGQRVEACVDLFYVVDIGLRTRLGCVELTVHAGVTCGVVLRYVSDSLGQDYWPGVSNTPVPGARPEADFNTLDGHCLLKPRHLPVRLVLHSYCFR